MYNMCVDLPGSFGGFSRFGTPCTPLDASFCPWPHVFVFGRIERYSGVYDRLAIIATRT